MQRRAWPGRIAGEVLRPGRKVKPRLPGPAGRVWRELPWLSEKARPGRVTLLLALAASCIAAGIAACATAPRPRPPLLDGSFATADSMLALALARRDAGQPAAAAILLRGLGREHYSYYRMDEVLYWLGRCRAESGDLARAARCFDVLHRHYPRCGARFADLDSLRAEIGAGTAPVTAAEATAGSRARAPAPLSASSADLEPRVSNVFYETDVRQALMDVSAQTGVSIISDALTHGYVTAEFQDIPLEQCLERMLTPLGLSFRRMDGYYLVGAPVAESPSYPLFTTTQTVELRYRTAAEMMRSLPPYYQSYARADGETNVLAITAPSGIIAAFERDVAALDRPSPQVMIEAMIVEMSSEARRVVGLDWDWTGTRDNAVFSVSRLLPALVDSALVGEIFKTGERYKDIRYDLRAALRLMAANGKAEVQANPRVTTQDGREATIRIVREAYYSLVRGNVNFPYVTLEKIDTGISLKITPYVGDSGEIMLAVAAEVSDVAGSSTNDLPVTSVRSAESHVRVPNGQTFGIGGLVFERRSHTETGIPLLSDIPLLGDWLFSHTLVEKEDAEVVILVTPHILIDPALFDEL